MVLILLSLYLYLLLSHLNLSCYFREQQPNGVLYRAKGRFLYLIHCQHFFCICVRKISEQPWWVREDRSTSYVRSDGNTKSWKRTAQVECTTVVWPIEIRLSEELRTLTGTLNSKQNSSKNCMVWIPLNVEIILLSAVHSWGMMVCLVSCRARLAFEERIDCDASQHHSYLPVC